MKKILAVLLLLVSGFVSAQGISSGRTTLPKFYSPVTSTPNTAATDINSFHSLFPHAYTDSLIGGVQQCLGIYCGSKEYNSTRGYGLGLFINSDKEIGFGYVTALPTAEASFTWPAYFKFADATFGSILHVHSVALIPTTAATCSATYAGQFQYIQGNASTKDIVQVCAHDATNTYAWRTIY